eukprot:TRINITY_DN3773_c0_g1_i2.p1 TRINITY_DN3773_c0_g1~~TRINITY_DN3773_c0_g1_i2.p1  ORF type:complete len:123 (-),score=23.01 TRINITY_DN3773_c0_g1_i2:113-481(-)
MRAELMQEPEREKAYLARAPSTDSLNLSFGPVFEVASGRAPHTWGSYEIIVQREDLADMVDYMMFRHQQNPVLVHPVAMGETLNHTDRAMWFGTPTDLNMDSLIRSDDGLRKIIKGKLESFN